jgi:hypothetical protein
MAETNSQAIVGKLQARYGTYARGQLQSQRKQYWSYIPYTNSSNAAQATYTFFGSALGDQQTPNLQRTNLPVQGSFGTSAFLLKSIQCSIYIPSNATFGVDYSAATTTYATDATSGLWADMVSGFAQAGILRFSVGAKNFVTIPKPFLYAPPADGRSDLQVTRLVGTATPTYSVGAPEAELHRLAEEQYLVDPELYVDFQENFRVSIDFPAGTIPQIGTTSLPATSGNLYVGCILDGVEFRPVQ